MQALLIKSRKTLFYLRWGTRKKLMKPEVKTLKIFISFHAHSFGLSLTQTKFTKFKLILIILFMYKLFAF